MGIRGLSENFAQVLYTILNMTKDDCWKNVVPGSFRVCVY